jgi:hypothetical protein
LDAGFQSGCFARNVYSYLDTSQEEAMKKTMRKSKLETAQSLAEGHFRVEPNLVSIHLIEPIDQMNPDEPIRLLEVVKGTIERGIEPVGFTADPAHGIDYPSIIIEVSPEEYKSVRQGRLHFPNRDWTIGQELVAR